MSTEHRLDHIIRMVQDGLFLRTSHRPSLVLQNEVLRYFVEQRDFVRDLSLNGIVAMMALAQAEPDKWRALAAEDFRRVPRETARRTVPVLQAVRRPSIVYGPFEDCAYLIPSGSVDLILTSPVYALQRSDFYVGVSEADYPKYTSRWMSEARRILKPAGSVLINIRPHIVDGETVSYVQDTITRLRADGWRYRDGFIWNKPDAPPMGHRDIQRRAWESVHWFFLDKTPYCNPRAGGKPTERLGLSGKKGFGDGGTIHAVKAKPYRSGIARQTDVITVPVGSGDRSHYNTHPAQFPVDLARTLIRMHCPRGGMIVDPFVGSGTTAVAAALEHCNCTGFEIHGGYVNIGRLRLKEVTTKRVDSRSAPPKHLV